MKGIGFRGMAAALAVLFAAAGAFAQVPQDYPSGYRKLITAAQREGNGSKLVNYWFGASSSDAPLNYKFVIGIPLHSLTTEVVGAVLCAPSTTTPSCRRSSKR
jgi:opacity protein-like surface antigen